MSVTREELAAFADGELPALRREAVVAAVEADPVLAAEVAAHRALKNRLAAHFAPILDQPLPERLFVPLLARQAEVVDFASARAARDERRGLPRWAWAAGPALAASLALGLFMGRGGEQQGYADPSLASALDNQLVGTQPAQAPTRILLSFQDKAGLYCRAFSAADRSGIACRDSKGWKVRQLGAGTPRDAGDYRQAGSEVAVMEAAQAMASGPALDAAGEAAAKGLSWQQP